MDLNKTQEEIPQQSSASVTNMKNTCGLESYFNVGRPLALKATFQQLIVARKCLSSVFVGLCLLFESFHVLARGCKGKKSNYHHSQDLNQDP